MAYLYQAMIGKSACMFTARDGSHIDDYHSGDIGTSPHQQLHPESNVE